VLVVVVLVLMVAMIVVDVVEVPTVRHGLVPAVRAMYVHVANMRRVALNLAIGRARFRLVAHRLTLRGMILPAVHEFIICPRARDARVMEHFRA
jgi:hypothetical protein